MHPRGWGMSYAEVNLEQFFALAQDAQQQSEDSIKLSSVLSEASRKVFFITAMPIYWFIIFNFILHTFNQVLFVFVVLISSVLTLYDKGWGIIHNVGQVSV